MIRPKPEYVAPVSEDDLSPEHTIIDPVEIGFGGEHPKTAEVTITLRGPLCKVQDYGAMIVMLARRYANESPGKPCGCKDKKE